MCEQMNLWFATNLEDEPKKEKVTEDDLQEKHDKKYIQRLLTPQEWELYRLIKYNSEILDRRTSQKEIADKLGLKWNDDPSCHDHCPKVWTLIKNLNESDEIEKVIISFNFTYWLGGKEETKVFLDKLWSDLAPRLTRYWKYLKKTRNNGQGKLISCQNQPIDSDSQAREWVERYIND